MGKKLNYENVKTYIENQGYMLVSDSYKNAFEKIHTVCPQGHDYIVRYYSFKDGHRCATCSGSKKKSIQDIKSLFKKENYILLSTEYKNNSGKLDVVCPVGHQFKITYSHFSQGIRCSVCAGNKKKNIKEIKECFEKEGYILLSTEYKNTHTPIQVLCPQKHESHVTVANFKQGHRCLDCSGKKKKTIEDIKTVFEKENYILLSTEYKNAISRLSAICPEGHACTLTYGDFKDGHRCLECSGHKRKTLEEVKNYFFNEKYIVLNIAYENSLTDLLVVCPLGHKFNTKYRYFQSGRRCPVCSNSGFSKHEKEIYEFIKNFYPETIENTYEVISPLELDIYIPELRLAIEYTGLYWHSEEYKNKNYHYNKMKICNEKGIRLITIFEDEWLERQDQVKNFLSSVLNKNAIKLMARKTELKEVSKEDATVFLNNHHIQGAPLIHIAYGLYYNNELQAVITGNKHHRQGYNETFVLNRLAFKSGVSISGGSSKLLKTLLNYTKENGYKRLISWSDNRWSEGNVYGKLGFQLTENSGPDYSYVQKQRRISKQSCKKKSLIQKGAKGTMENTEKELAITLNLRRIWDCGKKRWEINL
jgi:hypothetical protein